MTDEIHLVEIFHTFQGEGAYAGRRALFIRMPFCNLSCTWCDTQFDKYEKWEPEKIKEFAERESCRFAVLTGGEPTMHKHTPRVVEILRRLNFFIAVETNGTFEIPEGIDFVTVSPKRDAEYKIHEHAYLRADEFKYVVDRYFDFSILTRHEEDAPLVRHSLSPEWNERDENLNKIFNYIKEHPEWRISLQTHKWMGVR